MTSRRFKGFLGEDEAVNLGKGVFPEWSVSRESQKKLWQSDQERSCELQLTHMAVGGWQADIQKALPKIEGGVALTGKQEVAVPLGGFPGLC